MDGGSLNLRNDEVFDKLDSAPRKDVNKLIQLQKETNANNIAKQRRDSLNAIEESLFKLDIFEEAAAEYKTGKEQENKKEKHENTVFYSIVNNLNSDNDSFLKKIETLYNILFKSYKSELIIRKKLGNYYGSINDADEYVKNRILGRIIFNIEYFRNFTKEYEKYDFEDVINKIKRIPELSMPQDYTKISGEVNNLLKDNIIYNTDISKLINLITGDKKEGGAGFSWFRSKKNNFPKSSINIDSVNASIIGPPSKGSINIDSVNASIIGPPSKGSINIDPVNASITGPPEAPFDKIADTLFETYTTELNRIEDEIAKSYIKRGVKLIMLILYRLGLTKNELRGGGSPEKTTESNLLEYVKRSGENAILVLTKDTKIKKKDAIEAIINLILTQSFLSKNLDNKVNFYVLEVFYGIIYGTLLTYDLRLKEENKYIIERVENLSQVYSIINDIIYDQTYRTLKQLYNRKYPGFRNIFRIDSLYNDVFTRKETNKTEKGSFTEENEYNLRDLVILKINNGAVDIEDFQKLLTIMYKNNEYQDLYKFLHEVSNIYNLGKEIKILQNAKYAEEVDRKTEELKQQINYADEISKQDTSTSGELGEEKGGDMGNTGNSPLARGGKVVAEQNQDRNDSNSQTGRGDILIPGELKAKLTNFKAALDNKSIEFTTNFKAKLDDFKTKLDEFKAKVRKHIDSLENNNISNGDVGSDDIVNKTDNDLYKVIAAILELDLSPEDSAQTDENKDENKFSGLFSKYINKKMGGTNINPINIKTPVSGYDEPTLNVKKCDSSIVEPMTRITEQLDGKLGGGLEEDYEKIKIKKEELKAKLENPTVDDDITESITDNAKRKLNKVKNSIKQFFNTKENVEEDIPKVLDEEYLNELKKFNINSVKTQSYKELRKNLYRIKNNEYFEDIKITNEDIYTFIATTYVLRVISLYITMWFIQIEIVKDVESVIVSYILTYILLFILIYTFVNLSDNQLDTSKSFLYYFYSRVNFSYTRFIVHLGLLLLLIIIPFVIRTIDKESASYKHISDTEKRYLYTFITNMSTIVWVILSIIAFFFK
jgi:hypothetical protein